MTRTLLLVLCAGLFFSCKSVGGSTSGVKAWELEGSRQAAKAYIIQTVSKYYPDVGASEPALIQFAEALQNEKTSQPESSDYVLQELWQMSQAPASPEEVTPIENYIVQEWISHSNYLAVRSKAANVLEYLVP